MKAILTNLLFFVLGLTAYFLFSDWLIEHNREQLKEMFITGYSHGRDDGYNLGRAEYELTDEMLDSKCMFWQFDGMRK